MGVSNVRVQWRGNKKKSFYYQKSGCGQVGRLCYASNVELHVFLIHANGVAHAPDE